MSKNIIKKKIVLGSKSPRRMQLMSEAGYDFVVRTQDTDESFDPQLPVSEVAEMLAQRKASALEHTLVNEEYLVTADSVVIVNEKIYNKPSDYDEGIEMLNALSGKKHSVITGVCIMTLNKKVSFSVISEVEFDIITDAEKDFYMTIYKPYDKAGGYGIQDWIGLCKVAAIKGSYTNIMGLPMRELYIALGQFDQ